jgi:hypothetical protein
MYLLVTARKGISSMQIAKEIGVQQKSAWFMLHRLLKPPKILDKIVDVVLKYRPEAKQKPPRQRKISTKRLSDAESKKRESKT